MKASEELLKWAKMFDEADRLGLSIDKPEGMRYVQISDTLMKEFTAILRKIGGKLEGEGK